MLEKAIAKIREQADESKNYNVRYLASELIGILRHHPDKAEIVLQDLDNADMSITKCENKIAEYFRKNRNKPQMSGPLKVISDFYGLNIDAEKTAELIYAVEPVPVPEAAKPARINIDDFI